MEKKVKKDSKKKEVAYFTVQIPTHLKDEFKSKIKGEGKSIRHVVFKLIEDYLKKNKS